MNPRPLGAQLEASNEQGLSSSLIHRSSSFQGKEKTKIEKDYQWWKNNWFKFGDYFYYVMNAQWNNITDPVQA